MNKAIRSRIRVAARARSSRLRRCLMPAALLLVYAGMQSAFGQELIAPVNGVLLAPSDGFHIYDATLSLGYTSFSGAFAAAPAADQFGIGPSGWSSLALGYSHTRARRRFAIDYTPSYFRSFEYSASGSFDQVVDMSFATDLGKKVDYFANLTASDTTLQQFVFTPAVVTQAVVGSSAGTTSVTSPGALTSPATETQTSFYGTRMLTYGGRTGFNYKPTTRLRLGLSATASEADARPLKNETYEIVVPHTLLEQGVFDLTYSLSPRTDIGFEAMGNRTSSVYGHYLESSLGMTMARKLSQRWFASIEGGAGTTNSVGESVAANGVGWEGSATLEYRGRENAISGAYRRMVGDFYGLGSSSTTSYSADWKYKRHDLNWTLNIFGEEQILTGAALGNLSTYQAGTGISRALSRQVSISIDAVYFEDKVSGSAPSSLPNLTARMIRMTFGWIPFLRDTPPLGPPTGGAQ